MLRAIVVLLSSLVLFGCGTKFIYNNIDWFVLQYIDDFVDLSDKQEQHVVSILDRSIPWHRSSEVPQYLQQLNQLKDVDPRAVTSEFIDEQERQFKQHSIRLIDHFMPSIVAFVSKLSDQQAEELMNSIRVKHVKFKRKYEGLNDEELREVYREHLEDNMSDWIGRLNKDQQQILDQWVSELDVTIALWLDYQTNLRIQLKTLLANRQQIELLEEGLTQLLYNPEQYYSEELRQSSVKNKLIGQRYVVLIGQKMSDRQIEHWRDELQDWIDIGVDLENNQ